MEDNMEDKTFSPEEPRSTETPLDSWKSIAAYLNRDVSTVKRWEKDEGLPVHRHMHMSRASVYAFPSELDAWVASRKPSAEPALAPRWRTALALAATLVLSVLTAGSSLLVTSTRAADGPAIVAKRIWSGAVDDLGAPSPDGRYLSFVDWSTGDLAIRDLTTGENKRITNKGTWSDSNEYAEFSIFSPDGQRLAFAWFNQKTASYELRVIGRDGSQPRVLYSHPEMFYIQPVAWTPDMKQIVCATSAMDRTNRIVVVNEADGSVRTLKTFDWRYPRPRLSPDGRWLAYDFPPKEEASQRDIFLLALDGTREVPAVQSSANDFLLGWSPDGGQILFASDRTGDVAAWSLNISAGRPAGSPALVRQHLGRIRPIGIAPTGAMFYSVPAMRDVIAADYDARTGRVTSDVRNATDRFQGSNHSPAWSPDGKWMAFQSIRGSQGAGIGSVALVIRSVETGEEWEIVPQLHVVANANHRNFEWTSDGKSLAVSARDEKGRPAIYLVDAPTGAVRRFYQPDPREGTRRFYLFPDGKSLLLERGTMPSRQPALVQVDAATGKERVIHISPHIHAADLSRDGRFVALTTVSEEDARATALGEPNANRLLIVPIAGGQPRQILHVPQDQEITSVVWTPDQRHLLLTIQVGGSENPLPESNQVWRISVDGGKPEPVNLTMSSRELRSLRFHPDGRRLAFTRIAEQGNEIWVMENFLPALRAGK